MAQITLEPLAPREAIEFFRSKGLAPALQRFDWRDHWREEHAHGFVVAKAMRDDVLEAIREEFLTALEEGRTLDQFREDLTPKLQAFGWWGRQIERDPVTGELVDVQLGSRHRLRTIFDTNMRTSYAAGKWARIQRTKQAFPYLEYVQIERDTKRKEHERYDGLIRPVDDPIWAVIFPPNGFFCGCYVRQLNDRMLRREGKTVSDPVELELDERVNGRTGDIEEVPLGVHSGFDTNPGAIWLDLSDRHADTRLDLPDSHVGTDRGLVQYIRQFGIRDGFESMATFDLDRSPEASYLRLVRADPGKDGKFQVRIPDDILDQMADPDRSLVTIHNHPSSSSFSSVDLATFSQLPGLSQLVAVGHDGSIHRIARTAITHRMTPTLPSIVSQAVSETLPMDRLDLRSEVEYKPILSHIWMMVFHRLGLLRYAASHSGRNADALRRNQSTIDTFVERLAERLR